MSINTSLSSHFIGGRWIYRHPSWCMIKCPVCDVRYRGYGWYDKVCYKCFDEDEKFNADMRKAIAIIERNRRV